MKNAWQDVVDIIPVKMLDDGMEVRINERSGLIYELPNAWVLMLTVKSETRLAEDRWLAISCLLLSSYGELGCGLSSFQDQWWLSRRYNDAKAADAALAVAQQLSLASFIEKWPELMQHQQVCSALPLNPVINKWA